jgi:hypothetical protein
MTSVVVPGANAHAADETVNHTTPMQKIRRLP